MKNWNGHGDALVAPRRVPVGTRFLTAAFVALVLIAGLDTSLPNLKHPFIPEPGSQPQAGIGHASESFDWSQVCVEHS